LGGSKSGRRGLGSASNPAKAKLTDHDMIVVAEFVNKTGDPAFDDTLRQGLVVQLQQSPFLSLVSDQKIRATLKLMGKPADAQLTGDAAREVCERVGARAVLTGSITSLGAQYVMNLRADGCASGDSLDNQQADAAGKEQVLKTLGEMAGRFRSRAGESLATVREHNVPLEEATTPSIEALRAYTAGIALSGNRFDESVRELRRATELDPQFAAAWSILRGNSADCLHSVACQRATRLTPPPGGSWPGHGHLHRREKTQKRNPLTTTSLLFGRTQIPIFRFSNRQQQSTPVSNKDREPGRSILCVAARGRSASPAWLPGSDPAKYCAAWGQSPAPVFSDTVSGFAKFSREDNASSQPDDSKYSTLAQ
jgi:TolB-like protein